MTPEIGGKFCSFFEKKFILSLKKMLYIKEKVKEIGVE
jgi:hypothetical protein